MFVKKFEAPSLDKALAMVKAEFGPNALVLSTHNKKVKWYQKPSVEVTAAAERKPEDNAEPEFDETELERVFPHRRKIDLFFAGERAATKAQPSTSVSKPREKAANRELKYDEVTESSPRPIKNDNYESSFLRLGIHPENAKELTRRLIFDYSKEDRANSMFLEKTKSKLIAQSIQSIGEEQFLEKPIWTFVGLPGSGKTTLIAKLAILVKNKKKAVSLVSFDRRKIAGRHELASYSRALRVPYSLELKHDRNSSRIQLVDTPALSFGGQENRGELLKSTLGTQHVVVVDVCSRLDEMLRTIDRAAVFEPQAIVFTKVDLSCSLGVIYDCLKACKLPVLGISVSSGFKEPFRFVSKEELAQMIIKGRVV